MLLPLPHHVHITPGEGGGGGGGEEGGLQNERDWNARCLTYGVPIMDFGLTYGVQGCSYQGLV